MAKDKFALGIDYGTESGRVVVVQVGDGEQIASAIVPYPDGVIDEKLPGGPRLDPADAGHGFYGVVNRPAVNRDATIGECRG